MTEFPDPADLDPEIATKGSLAIALEETALAAGIVLSGVEANGQHPLLYATVASTTPLRKALSVWAGHPERYWGIDGWGQGIQLLGGSTPDLAEVVKAAQLWSEGAPLAEIVRVAPFARLGRLAIAAEQGPEHVVAAQWKSVLDDAATVGWPEYLSMVEAAYAEPRLRQLYPYTSHLVLRFSTTTGYPFSPDLVTLERWEGRPYTVRKTWYHGDILGEVATADEAVALAVRHLPDNLGPAAAGTYPEADLRDTRDSGVMNKPVSCGSWYESGAVALRTVNGSRSPRRTG